MRLSAFENENCSSFFSGSHVNLESPTSLLSDESSLLDALPSCRVWHCSEDVVDELLAFFTRNLDMSGDAPSRASLNLEADREMLASAGALKRVRGHIQIRGVIVRQDVRLTKWQSLRQG